MRAERIQTIGDFFELVRYKIAIRKIAGNIKGMDYLQFTTNNLSS